MIEVKGLKEVIGNLNKYSQTILRQIDSTLTEGANDIEARAKMLAPVDEGLMRNDIIATTSIPFDKIVTCNTFYAPYIEFGTGRKFEGNGRDSIAAEFKGKSPKGGSFDDFVKNMVDYIKRHGGFPANVKTPKQRESYARFVCIRIYKNGIKAQPFFFRALDEVQPNIIQDLKNIIK